MTISWLTDVKLTFTLKKKHRSFTLQTFNILSFGMKKWTKTNSTISMETKRGKCSNQEQWFTSRTGSRNAGHLGWLWWVLRRKQWPYGVKERHGKVCLWRRKAEHRFNLVVNRVWVMGKRPRPHFASLLCSFYRQSYGVKRMRFITASGACFCYFIVIFRSFSLTFSFHLLQTPSTSLCTSSPCFSQSIVAEEHLVCVWFLDILRWMDTRHIKVTHSLP